MRQKSILLIGYFNNHVVGSKVEICRSLGWRVHAADIANCQLVEKVYHPDSSFVFAEAADDWAKETRAQTFLRLATECARSLKLLREDSARSFFAKKVLAAARPDILWGVWGEGALTWLRVFVRCGYEGPLLWTANVFPNLFKSPDLPPYWPEAVLYRRWLGRLHCIIVTNERMREYIKSRYPLISGRTFLQLPDFMPAKWYASVFTEPGGPRPPRVVYLGSPERYGHVIDEVDHEMKAIADQGIDVHLAKPKHGSIAHSHIHYYDPFPDTSFVSGSFGLFINSFDAAVVCYNYKGFHPRFASTYPTRMLTSLCGCIPVFVKSGPLSACEEFVDQNRIGKVYVDARELAHFLEDSLLMQRLRVSAKSNRVNFAGDSPANLNLLRQLLHGLESRA
jgi:hypothetical protein